MASTPGRCALAVRHTAAWVLANAAEFDRRHLDGVARWVFSRGSHYGGDQIHPVGIQVS